jgi:hypothetical protein
MSVDVRTRAVTSRPEPRPRNAQLIAVAEDLDPPLGRIADHLALTGD